MKKNLSILLFILAFIEGGAVMCVELCSAKILSPYFGTSIYVWAAVLGITLTALMLGYYLGGYFSVKYKKVAFIFWLMLLAGCWVALTPLISSFVLPFTIQLSITTGSIVSLLFFLFFPLLLFGAVSPLIIAQLTEQVQDSGKFSGTVYSVSTLGGIFTTFLVGFYTLPEFGIKLTLYFYGFLVIFIALLLFFITKTFKMKTALVVVFTLLLISSTTKNHNHEILYESDGVLGNIKVVERQFYDGKMYRELMVNNISQTIMNIEQPEVSLWGYVDVLTYNINSYSNGKKALLLGMGGGTVYKQLINNGYEVDIVEIDARIEKLAKAYFYIEQDVDVIIDDARHYIRTTNKKYDVIIYDLYHSETPPVHLMTLEAFTDIQEKLTENGLLATNFYGFISGNKGRAARSLYKTLKQAQFDIHLIATPGEEQHRNLLYLCGKRELKLKQPLIHTMIYEMDLNFDDALLLVDDKPVLEHIYLEAALQWRKDYNEVNAKKLLK